jgi:hypothetical protein
MRGAKKLSALSGQQKQLNADCYQEKEWGQAIVTKYFYGKISLAVNAAL